MRRIQHGLGDMKKNQFTEAEEFAIGSVLGLIGTFALRELVPAIGIDKKWTPAIGIGAGVTTTAIAPYKSVPAGSAFGALVFGIFDWTGIIK